MASIAQDIVHTNLFFPAFDNKTIGIKNENISKNSNNTDTKRHNCFQVYGSRNTFQSRIIVDKHHQVKHHHRNDA